MTRWSRLTVPRETFTQNEIAPTTHRWAESASTPQRTAVWPISACRSVEHRDHASETDLKRTCSRDQDRPGIA